MKLFVPFAIVSLSIMTSSTILPQSTSIFSFEGVAQDTAESFTDSLPQVRRADPSEQRDRRRYESTKSPLVAVLLSTALPGAGQIYNESYWKAPIIWGIAFYWGYEWNQLNKQYKDFRGQYSQSLKLNPPLGNIQLKSVRDFYRDERDKFAWYLGALYLVNLLDAFVGANLYDFSVSPDLSHTPIPTAQITATVRYRF
jgi:hypothetical protein